MTENASPRRTAVVWDFDGTLVDSHPRNLSVNREIVQRLTGRGHESFPALGSLGAYEAAVARSGNWRDFYAREFGLIDEQVEHAGSLWPELQLADTTPQLPFSGIPEALEALAAVPHAILSQNDSIVIRRALTRCGIVDRFVTIIGHGELELADQKPGGGGLLRCIASLGLEDDAKVYFVGDHVTDAMCAADARRIVGGNGASLEIISVGAFFGEMPRREWRVAPDHVAGSPAEVVQLVRNGSGA